MLLLMKEVEALYQILFTHVLAKWTAETNISSFSTVFYLICLIYFMIGVRLEMPPESYYPQ